jgi:DNA polymerase-3 subunit alpha
VLESLIKVGALGSFGKRAALLDSFEALRSKVVKPKSEKNQPELFSGEDIVKTQSASSFSIMANIEEFSDEELQNLERQLLGFSLSAKPITELIGPLELQATHKIFEISPTETFGEQVKVAGVISEVRIIVTKRTGAEMAFVKLYDGTGSIDLVVFPNTFKSTRDFWTEGKPILVYGKVDNRQESASIVVESIETLANLTEKKEREVFINVPEGVSPEKLKNLKTLFQQNLGDKDAFLVFANGSKVKIPFKVDWSPDLAKAILLLLE